MADALGTIECTIENCLTDRDGSLVMSLRVKSGEKRSVEQILDKVFWGRKRQINGSQRNLHGIKKSEA